MTKVIPKKFPTISMSDTIYPVVIWKERPEIINIAIFDHKKRHITLKQAKDLYTQILYESNDFIFEKGQDNFKLNHLYKGIGIFNHRNNLKTLQTARHICHYI